MRQPVAKLPAGIRMVYFLLPIPVTWLVLSLMSQHMKYYKVGINMAANNGFLVFFVAPVLLLVLYLIAAAGLAVCSRLFGAPWPGILIGSALVVGAGLAAFLVKAQQDIAASTEARRPMGQFLHHYARDLTSRLQPAPP